MKPTTPSFERLEHDPIDGGAFSDNVELDAAVARNRAVIAEYAPSSPQPTLSSSIA